MKARILAVLGLAASCMAQSSPDRLPGGYPGAAAGPVNSDEYVGSTACSECHAAIYRSYKKTAMGQSIVPADPGEMPNLVLPGHFANAAIGRQFDIFLRDGKLFESEYALQKEGSESFRDTRQIRWLIGAGINGYGPVVTQDGYLFQAPLSYYSKRATWEPSPGYQGLDLGFNRPILTGCIFCHSGRAKAIAGTNGQYGDPPFSEPAIGCENCHGPGATHIDAMKGRTLEGKGTAIINPAHLGAYLADNICMGCHQTGDVRVLKPGKSYADVRPGRPLEDVLSIFIVPPTPESPPDADHVEHYYSMTLSKCFRASAGRMSCLNCHDPHVQPAASEAPAYYARKCLGCHTNQSCKIPLETRMHQRPTNDCIGCHMPKRDIQTISHSTATNHRIIARPDEPFPDVTFRQTTAALPDLIHLDPAPGNQDLPPPLLTQLEAYGELAAGQPRYASRYLAVLGTLEKSSPNDSLVQAALGRRELKAGNFPSAAEHLLLATQIGPPRPTTDADLAEALVHLNRREEAATWLEKSVALDPFNPFTQRSLVVQLIFLKEYEKARSALEHYVQVFPQDAYMRQMLEKAPAPH